jgi:zinc/manganese transport system permease protein
MTDLFFYLTQTFAQHALLAAVIVAVICGIIGPFVIMRSMAFAVHGTSELAFTGASAGLLVGGNPVAGALCGTLLFASIIGMLSVRERERDSVIGVILAFGLGVGVLLLSFYHGFASEATNILFGNIFGVSSNQLLFLVLIGIGATIALLFMYRPLLFASADPDVAEARGVPLKLIGVVFLLILAFAVTEAAQIVGTLLVLSLAITPAAAAQWLSSRPTVITLTSIAFALLASVGGLLASLASGTVKPSVFITIFSFSIYIAARLFGRARRQASAKTTE